jgi:alkylation response protein AidB-like acyl-CoA dehydrogenase
MDFQFTEEQQLLADSVKRLIERDYDFESRKKVLRSEAGYSESAWASLGEMGIFGMALSEASGGFGMGVLGMVPLMEQVGQGLLLEPVVSTLVCGQLVERLGGESEAELLGLIGQGQCRMALAWQEDGIGEDPAAIGLSARADGDAWRLDGEKIMVMHAPMAERILVVARVSGETGQADGLGVFEVMAGAEGLSLATMRTVDGYRAADLSMSNVPARCIGPAGQAYEAVDAALDFGNLLSCAEAVGAMDDANRGTLEYLKTRKQFGVPIGAFQALQHRMVDMTVTAQQARSILYMACDAFDRSAGGGLGVRERRHLVSAAKIKVSEGCRQIGQEAIQLHGGMGMTDEMKISHTFKRLTMISRQFGDVDHHLARFAATDG